MKLAGKTVWVTGATSGIGEALAYEFAARGTQLILSARGEARLQEVRLHCERPDEHIVVPLDLASGENIAAVAKSVLSERSVDVVVHNGGISQRSQTVDTDYDVYRRIMEVNYFGTVALTKAILPSMIARGAGQFVVISSLAGKFGTPRRSAYSASKHALHGFFGALQAEAYEAGIRVTMACPGYVRTNISKNALRGDGSRYELMDPNQEQGMDPAECARRIVDAARDEKAEVYIGGREVLGVYLSRYFPGLFRRILRKRNETA